MTRVSKAALWVGGVAAAALVYNLDSITGQWTFDRMCRAEGGSRFYAPVEKDLGWEVEGHDTYDYQWPFGFGHVAFVRYQDRPSARSDVRFEGYVGPGQRKYVFSPVNESAQVRYRFRFQSNKFPNDARFDKTLYQVTDLTTGQVIATHTQFGYRWTKPERVILSAPKRVGCWDLQPEIGMFYHGIYAYGSKK